MKLEDKEIEDLKKMAKEMGNIQSSASKSLDIAEKQIKELAGDKYEKAKGLQDRLIKAMLSGNSAMEESIKNDLTKLFE